MDSRQHIHTPRDGRGRRDIFVNGKKIECVFYADVKRGIVRFYRQPFKLDKYRKRALSNTVRGKVMVRAIQ